MAVGIPNTSGGDHAVGETHAPRQRGRNAVVAIAGNQAADSADGVANAGRRRTNIQKEQERNFQAARHYHQRHKSAQESAEPRKSIAAKEQIPRVGEKLAGTLQDVVEPRAKQAGKSGDANDKKAFVALPFVPWDALELRAAAVEIRLQDICGDEQRRGHHQAEGGNRNRAEMQKRNHKLDTRVYTARPAGP